MTPISLTYVGGLRCEAVHGPSGQKLLTDAPPDNMGKGEYFSPTDLVVTALGACVAITFGIIADREKVDLTGMKVSIEKMMKTDQPRRIGRIAIRVVMPCKVTDEQKIKFERGAALCPVRESLKTEVEMPIDIVYP